LRIKPSLYTSSESLITTSATNGAALRAEGGILTSIV
jgi:hypothetical protein